VRHSDRGWPQLLNDVISADLGVSACIPCISAGPSKVCHLLCRRPSENTTRMLRRAISQSGRGRPRRKRLRSSQLSRASYLAFTTPMRHSHGSCAARPMKRQVPREAPSIILSCHELPCCGEYPAHAQIPSSPQQICVRCLHVGMRQKAQNIRCMCSLRASLLVLQPSSHYDAQDAARESSHHCSAHREIGGAADDRHVCSAGWCSIQSMCTGPRGCFAAKDLLSNPQGGSLNRQSTPVC